MLPQYCSNRSACWSHLSVSRGSKTSVGKDRSTIARTSRKDAAPPVARICIATFPKAVASAGPATTFLPSGISSQLVQQTVLRSPTDDPNLLDTLSTHVLQITKNKAIFERKALQNTPYVRTGFLGNGLVGPRAEHVDGCEHVGGA